MSGGVSRLGGSGIGGGMAAGRHRANPSGRTVAPGPAFACISCGRQVTTTLVVQSGRLYCSPDCATTSEVLVPGLYLG